MKRSISFLLATGLFLSAPGLTTAKIAEDLRPFGRVDDISLSAPQSNPPRPLVIHIQTAHGQYDIQKKIQSLLGYFSRELNIRLLLAEGAGVKLEPEIDRYFQTESRNEEVMERRAKKGFADGVSLFLAGPDAGDVEAYGVESIEAYRKNRRNYTSLIENFSAAKNDVESFEMTLDGWMSKKLHSKLYQFLKSEKEYKAGRTDPSVYLRKTVPLAKNQLKRYPELNALWQIHEREGKEENEPVSEVGAALLLEELDKLARSLANQLASSKEEKLAVRIFFRFETLKQLLLLEIGRDGFEKINAKPAFFEPAYLYGRLLRLGLDEQNTIREGIVRLNLRFREALEFYNGAVEREEGMVKNSIDRITSHHTETALLVTGGFHSKGLKERFLKEGISYVLISPTSEEVLSLSKRIDFDTFLKKLPRPVSFAAIEDGTIRPVFSQQEKHGFDPAYFRDLRLWAVRDLVSETANSQDFAILREEFNQSPFAVNFAVSMTANRPPAFRMLSSLKRPEMRSDFFKPKRLDELRNRIWLRGKKKLSANAADVISELMLDQPVPAWTSHIEGLLDWLRVQYVKNRAAGQRTAIFLTGLQGTAKSSIAKTLGDIIASDEALIRAGLSGVRTVAGDRSRFETAPDDFEIDGTPIGEFRQYLRNRYPQYLQVVESFEAAQFEDQKEHWEAQRKMHLDKLNRFNADLDQLGLRPLNINGDYSEDIYRQNDREEQNKFWMGVKGKLTPGQISPLDQHLTFFDLNSRGRLRLRLSDAGNLQIVFRLKSKVRFPGKKFVDGHLLAELTQGEVPDGAWRMDIEPLPTDNKSKTWKLAFKEGDQWLTEEEVRVKTEFFEMNPVIRRIEQARGRHGKSKGFSVAIHGSNHTVLIPRHKNFFELQYDGVSNVEQVKKGEFKEILIRQPLTTDEIYLFDWSVPVALNRFDAIFILTADPTVRLARQVDRYDPRKATISLADFTDHLQESFYKIDPWINHELDKIQQHSKNTGHPKIWVGSTTNREDVIISHVQGQRLKDPRIEEVFKRRFHLLPTDFPGREEQFKTEGQVALIQEMLNPVPPQVALEQLEAKDLMLEEWLLTPGGVLVLRSGEFLYKGRLTGNHFSLSPEDIALVDEIRKRASDEDGNPTFVDFNVIDFKGRPYPVEWTENAESGIRQSTVTFGVVFVNTRGVSLEDNLDYLRRIEKEARLNAQTAAAERYEAEIARVEAAAKKNDQDLASVGLINTTPERGPSQKIRARDGRIIHSSFSTLTLQQPSALERLLKTGLAKTSWGPPVPFIWTPESDHRQRRLVLPLIVRSKSREINIQLRQDAQDPDQRDVQGMGQVLRWIDFYEDRVSYRNTTPSEIIEQVFEDLNINRLTFDDSSDRPPVETLKPLTFDEYWERASAQFLTEYPHLDEVGSTDRIVLDHFIDFVPRHFWARAVILDYDGVITQYHNNHFIYGLFKQTFAPEMSNKEFQQIFESIFSHNEEVRAVRDTAMAEEGGFEAYIALLNKTFQFAMQSNAEVSIGDYLAYHRGPEILDPAAAPLVNQWLAQGIRVLVLTDQYAGTGAESRVRKNIAKQLPGIRQEDIYFSFSSGIRARKNKGKEAFRLVLETLEAQKAPGEILFIDNSGRNVLAARGLGIQGLHYVQSRQGRLDDAVIVSPLKLRAELRQNEIMAWVRFSLLERMSAGITRLLKTGPKNPFSWAAELLVHDRVRTGYIVGPEIFKRLGPVLPALQKMYSTKIRFAIVAENRDLDPIREAVRAFNQNLSPKERLHVYEDPHAAWEALKRYEEVRGLGIGRDANLLRNVLPQFVPWSEAQLDTWIGSMSRLGEMLATFREIFERLHSSA